MGGQGAVIRLFSGSRRPLVSELRAALKSKVKNIAEQDLVTDNAILRAIGTPDAYNG